MKKFLSKIAWFSTFSIFIIALIWGISYVVLKDTSFKLPADKTILIIGDSHPECAIDDTIISNAHNLSHSGTALFYSFLKVRKIVEENPQIKTIVVGYNYEDLTESKNSWLLQERYLKSKVPPYFFLMKPAEFGILLKRSPLPVLSSLISSPFPLVSYWVKPKKDIKATKTWGGFQRLSKQAEFKDEPELITDSTPIQASIDDSYQLQYLKQIYDFARQHGKDVILINSPVRISKAKENRYFPAYLDFARTYLPDATLLNHASLEIPINGFADATHLNYHGAGYYSNYLKDQGLL